MFLPQLLACKVKHEGHECDGAQRSTPTANMLQTSLHIKEAKGLIQLLNIFYGRSIKRRRRSPASCR